MPFDPGFVAVDFAPKGKLITFGGKFYRRKPGEGCMLDNSSKRAGRDPSLLNWCHNSPPPWTQGSYPSAPTIGGQCSKDDALLLLPCVDNPLFSECRATLGVGGYNVSGPTLCLTATQLAKVVQRSATATPANARYFGDAGGIDTTLIKPPFFPARMLGVSCVCTSWPPGNHLNATSATKNLATS